MTGWPRNQHAKTASAPMPGLTLSTRKYSNCGLTTKRNKQEEMMLNQLVFQTGKYAFLSPPPCDLESGLWSSKQAYRIYKVSVQSLGTENQNFSIKLLIEPSVKFKLAKDRRKEKDR